MADPHGDWKRVFISDKTTSTSESDTEVGVVKISPESDAEVGVVKMPSEVVLFCLELLTENEEFIVAHPLLTSESSSLVTEVLHLMGALFSSTEVRS